MEFIITDIDGTIVDNRKRKQICVNLITGHEFSFAEVNARFGLEHLSLTQDEKIQIFKLFGTNDLINDPRCIDTVIPGATEALQNIMQQDYGIIYLTGRHHDPDNHDSIREGTIKNFRIHGFPLPDNIQMHLVMKPNRDERDDVFKKQMYDHLLSWGLIRGIFGNRPNDFPENTRHGNPVRIAITCTNEKIIRYPSNVIPVKDWKEAYPIMDEQIFNKTLE